VLPKNGCLLPQKDAINALGRKSQLNGLYWTLPLGGFCDSKLPVWKFPRKDISRSNTLMACWPERRGNSAIYSHLERGKNWVGGISQRELLKIQFSSFPEILYRFFD
jgi:hypothetical protein